MADARDGGDPDKVIAANTDKVYLRDLESAGIAVVPTTWVAPDEDPPPPRHCLEEMDLVAPVFE